MVGMACRYNRTRLTPTLKPWVDLRPTTRRSNTGRRVPPAKAPASRFTPGMEGDILGLVAGVAKGLSSPSKTSCKQE
jgi:hypothetical protein